MQLKRCNVTAVADDVCCLFRDLEIDPSWTSIDGPFRAGVMRVVNSVDERDLSLQVSFQV